MHLKTLAIVGVGLIGGSIALAARRRCVADRIVGIEENPEALDLALKQRLVDQGFYNLTQGVRAADFIVFSTPVDCIARQVLQAGPHCREGALLTDVGSTKAQLVAEIEQALSSNATFIGSHPLAGSEKQGPLYADADLLVNRLVVVTPTAQTKNAALERLLSFWKALGASVRIMSPREHDDALALTSHLPHLVAAALAGILPPHWYELTASGFRDTTRLAASNPALWAAIFRSNSDPVLHGLDRFISQLQHFRDAIAADDHAALLHLLERGKKVKDDLS